MRYHAVTSGRVRGPTDLLPSPTLTTGRLFAVLLLMLHTVAAADSVRVDLRGVDGAMRANVLAHLGDVRIDPRRRLSERATERILATSRQRIRDALKPYGYYAPEIDAALRQDRDDFVLTLRVQPGAPVRIAESEVLFTDHEINRTRLELGEAPATHVWPWGQGRKPQMETFEQRFGLRGAFGGDRR